jgi:hypothetical protein
MIYYILKELDGTPFRRNPTTLLFDSEFSHILHSRRFMRENEEEDENENSKPEDEELFEDAR